MSFLPRPRVFRDLPIVTYGNGVPTALQARERLLEKTHGSFNGAIDAVVIDCPTLSHLPQGLKCLLPQFKAVVFADVCKLGQHPHAGLITKLQQEHLLPENNNNWQSVAAAPTYNPLGKLTTFLSVDDILDAVDKLDLTSDE